MGRILSFFGFVTTVCGFGKTQNDILWFTFYLRVVALLGDDPRTIDSVCILVSISGVLHLQRINPICVCTLITIYTDGKTMTR